MTRPLVIDNAEVISPADGRQGRGWLRIEAGRITQHGDGPAPAMVETDRLDAQGLALSPALIDIGVRWDASGAAGDDAATLEKAALAGGALALALDPTAPTCVDTPELVSATMAADADRGVDMAVLGRLTKDDALCELALMQAAGMRAAVGALGKASLLTLKRALAYAADLDLPVIVDLAHPDLDAGAVAHDSTVTAALGLPAACNLGERVALQTWIALGETTGARIIANGVTSAQTLAMAQDAGLPVIMAAANLTFNDVDLGGMDAAFHLRRPVREEADRAALTAALDSPTTIVASHHDAVSAPLKSEPFADAAPGAPGLETLLSAVIGAAEGADIAMSRALHAVTTAPADVLGLPGGRLARNAPADLVVFDPAAPWSYRAAGAHTSGGVSPYEGRLLTGRVQMVMRGGKIVYDATTMKTGAVPGTPAA